MHAGRSTPTSGVERALISSGVTMSRPRAEVEQSLIAKRRERVLYVSPDGVTKVHAELDRLLDEWEVADAVVQQQAGH